MENELFNRLVGQTDDKRGRRAYLTVTQEVNGIAVFIHMPKIDTCDWDEKEFVSWFTSRNRAISFAARDEILNHPTVVEFVRKQHLKIVPNKSVLLW